MRENYNKCAYDDKHTACRIRESDRQTQKAQKKNKNTLEENTKAPLAA